MDTFHFTIVLICFLTRIDGSVSETTSTTIQTPVNSTRPKLENATTLELYTDAEKVNTESVCILDVEVDMPSQYEPLLLRQDPFRVLTLVFPDINGTVRLKEGEKIIIAFLGKNNYIKAIEKSISEGFCNNGSFLEIEGVGYKARELGCNSRVSALTKTTKIRCAEELGIIVELGYRVFQDSWLSLIEVCFDDEQSRAFHSSHHLYPAISRGSFRKHGRPVFSPGDNSFFKWFDPKVAYSRKNQKAVFVQTLGKEYAKKYLDSSDNMYFARGKLTPFSDFIMTPHQAAVYFYINAAPQWQTIETGNWQKVEENVRELTAELGEVLEVVTGTEGVLKLKGKKGRKEIMLQGSKLPIPEYFWKVIRNPKKNSCIAFVTTNDPYKKSKPSTICKDVCAEHGWPVLQKDYSKGYVFCCQYKDIKEAVPELPTLSCDSVLSRK